jgi:hypothetical protein
MAIFDLPAAIETVLGWSNKPQLVFVGNQEILFTNYNIYFIGHSQGCTLGFAGLLMNSSIAASVKL